MKTELLKSTARLPESIKLDSKKLISQKVYYMDAYSKAIDFFKAFPEKLIEVWDDPKSHWSGILFQAVTPDGYSQDNDDGLFCGDLCEIRSLMANAWTINLQEEIVNDPRIPKLYASNDYIPKLSIEILEVFADWQRKIDEEIGRNPDDFQVEE